MVWVPRGVDPATRDVLHEGVPIHLKPELMEWIKPAVSGVSAFGDRVLNVDVFRRYDVVARPSTPYSIRASRQDWPGFLWQLDGEEVLDLADWLVYHGTAANRDRLSNLLAEASSAWTVGVRNGHRGLERRVPEAVQAAADDAMSQGTAGSLLAEAWVACFGRAPNTEEAYEKAIKAVEESASSVVSPKNTKATLGTMIRDMKAQGDWKIDLPGTARDVPVSMMEALWTGQESRHGGNGYRIPTRPEAESAVMLAVTLVQWFVSGSVARRP